MRKLSWSQVSQIFTSYIFIYHISEILNIYIVNNLWGGSVFCRSQVLSMGAWYKNVNLFGAALNDLDKPLCRCIAMSIAAVKRSGAYSSVGRHRHLLWQLTGWLHRSGSQPFEHVPAHTETGVQPQIWLKIPAGSWRTSYIWQPVRQYLPGSTSIRCQ